MGRQATDLVWLGLEASGQSSRLGVTAEHPLYVEGRGWVQAGELAPGDRIVNAEGGVITVVSRELDDRPTLVHNLEVAGAHTYFAGELEAWAHNGKGTYLLQFSDGTFYAGKGDKARCNASVNRELKKTPGVKLISKLWWSAASEAESLLRERYLIDELGGVSCPLNRNKINPPGTGR
ncbi:polymorphic toxin-type HINT domain-containing protein [Frigidibacter sp. SD6-1]|uniref:polymorphic toxin-type HINT domain-containing protein n=1 Tax=Frigidibacter sp. SD6-1 TaxID=3032581 RepID=UPI0024DF32EC|nr:polymorphic toxin-type HINT domain-containing protein [Frigidibacter sp. SD6-1]